MTLNNTNSMRKDRGFTIVELLIVIVVIAILAAISIVAYTGITTKANSSAAKANAIAVQKVAETYFADEATSGYPTLAQLTGYTTGYAKIPTGVTVNSATLTSTQKDGKTIQYVPKGTTGACIGYWDANLATPAAAYVYAGNGVTGTNSATPTCA